MNVIAAPGGEDVHRKATAKAKAKSKNTKLRLGAVPGVWSVIGSSLANRHAPLHNEGWAMAHTKRTQHNAQKITGPQYFSPRLADSPSEAEDSQVHTDDMTSAGNCAAKHNTDTCPSTSSTVLIVLAHLCSRLRLCRRALNNTR